MKLYGVIGWPIKHSLSPVMHEAAFKKVGIKAEYRKFPVKPEELEDFLLNRKDVLGFNITIPYKIKAREILGKKFHVVDQPPYQHYDKITGAVNTVKRDGDIITYCNTDPSGFFHSLDKDLGFKKTSEKSAVIIGCGGASRAVAAVLSDPSDHMKKIYLYDIDKDTIDASKKHYSALPQWESYLKRKIAFIYDKILLAKAIEESQLLVNASPVGMEEGDERALVKKELLRKDLSVFDLVYNRKTRLFRDAVEKGANAVDGRGMLAAQGAFSFSLWTGIKPVEVVGEMKQALDKALDK